MVVDVSARLLLGHLPHDVVVVLYRIRGRKERGEMGGERERWRTRRRFIYDIGKGVDRGEVAPG